MSCDNINDVISDQSQLQFYRRLSESGEWGQEGAGQGAESDVERLHRTSSISEIEIGMEWGRDISMGV